MNGKLKVKLQNKTYRDTYVAETLRTILASQIEAIRTKNGWTQAELARRAGTTQNVISRLEDPSYGKFNLQTLLDLAAAFEVALLVKFVTFNRFVSEFEDISPDALTVSSFTDEAEAVKTTPESKKAEDDKPKATFDERLQAEVADNYNQPKLAA